MAAFDPAHFFEQAERLIAGSGVGARRQVDLRRAVSAAYYGVFHAIVTAVTDLTITAAKRPTPLYALAYRSIEHRAIRALCEDAQKPTLPGKYVSYVPAGFGPDIAALSAAFVELQKKRHAADYDPLIRVRRSEATLAVSTAKAAVARLAAADSDIRETFLILMVFPPRAQ